MIRKVKYCFGNKSSIFFFSSQRWDVKTVLGEMVKRKGAKRCKTKTPCNKAGSDELKG